MKKLNKEEQAYWDKVLEELDRDYPEIKIDTFSNLHVGLNPSLYDLNNKYNPEEDLIKKLDGEEEMEEEDNTPQMIELAEEMLEKLCPLHQDILKRFFYEEKSMAQIGRELGMSRQLVYYHKKIAIQTLQSFYNKG